MVYNEFEASSNAINLSNSDLTVVPDLCTLVRADDHDKIWFIDLSSNRIRIVDQDLGCLVNLKELNLSYNEIEGVKNLWVLPNLTTLKLQKNNLSTTQWLPDFPALEKLNLWFNSLIEATGLEKYTNLEVLELYHNEIETLVWLENLQQLEQLKVEFNNIKDFWFVETLKAQWLEVMTAKWNEIKESLLEELRVMNNDYINKLQEQFTLWAASSEVVIENVE